MTHGLSKIIDAMGSGVISLYCFIHLITQKMGDIIHVQSIVNIFLKMITSCKGLRIQAV